MHPWYDYPVDAAAIEDSFPVVIEVPRGSTNKYELDKPTGMLRLDRVLHSAVYCPTNYGLFRVRSARTEIRSTCARLGLGADQMRNE